MRDLLFPEEPPARRDPVALARAHQKVPLPRRFYKQVTVEARPDDGHVILLDGRPARTPARNLLALPTVTQAALVAAEWLAQETVIDAATMPATRIANSALDAVRSDPASVRDDIVSYAGMDLVCYRATEPEGLIAWQDRHFQPVLDWADQALGARLVLAGGIVAVTQPPESIAAVRRAAEALTDPVALAATHVMTTLSGSALIALMTAAGAIAPEAAFAAGDCDEAWNRQHWGEDAEAMARRARRLADFLAAASLARSH